VASHHATHVGEELRGHEHSLDGRLERTLRVRIVQVRVQPRHEERGHVQVDVRAAHVLHRLQTLRCTLLVLVELHAGHEDRLERVGQTPLVQHQLHRHRAVQHALFRKGFGGRAHRRDRAEARVVGGQLVEALQDFEGQTRGIVVDGAVRVARDGDVLLGDAHANVRRQGRREIGVGPCEAAQRRLRGLPVAERGRDVHVGKVRIDTLQDRARGADRRDETRVGDLLVLDLGRCDGRKLAAATGSGFAAAGCGLDSGGDSA
jgi:hypothetical protein